MRTTPDVRSRDDCRITARFETGSEKYAWLSRVVYIGTGYFGIDKVGYRIFAVK